MKQIFFAFFFALSLANLSAASIGASTTALQQPGLAPETTSLALNQMKMDEFLNLTPASYKKMTGEKMGLKKTIQLKLAQKALKMQMKQRSKGHAGSAEISKGLYVVLAIIGLGWLAMGLLDDWGGQDWIIDLVLTLLFWLPGLIFALIKMKKYYS